MDESDNDRRSAVADSRKVCLIDVFGRQALELQRRTNEAPPCGWRGCEWAAPAGRWRRSSDKLVACVHTEGDCRFQRSPLLNGLHRLLRLRLCLCFRFHRLDLRLLRLDLLLLFLMLP